MTSAQGPEGREASRLKPVLVVGGVIALVIIVAVAVLLLAGGNKTQDGPGDPKISSSTAGPGRPPIEASTTIDDRACR